MNDETIYNEEVFHTGNGKPDRNPDYMDPDTGESLQYDATHIPSDQLVTEYLKRCNVTFDDEKEKNNHINYEGFNT